MQDRIIIRVHTRRLYNTVFKDYSHKFTKNETQV